MFKRKLDEGVVTPKMLMDENQKLRQENEHLKTIRENTEKTMERFNKEIAELKQIKLQYMQKLAAFDELEKGYKTKLDELLASK